MLENKKIYYSISEVCAKTNLEPHVLRYWESEFSQLRPKKNRAGNRAYREKDIEIIQYIKYLLYNEHYTIQGAKKRLAQTKDYQIPLQTKMPLPLNDSSANNTTTNPKDFSIIKEIIIELKNLLKILN
jgi:DNA-binding transcriptional MerR regulator